MYICMYVCMYIYMEECWTHLGAGLGHDTGDLDIHDCFEHTYDSVGNTLGCDICTVSVC